MSFWEPTETQKREANLTRFIAQVEAKCGLNFESYPSFYQWSIDNLPRFWEEFFEFSGIISDPKPKKVVDGFPDMLNTTWFPDIKLNFAENLLRASKKKEDAIIFWAEDRVKLRLSFDELREQVRSLQKYLIKLGVMPSDRIAGFIPNMPEAIICALAAASIGAIWSSCSPDFGVSGALDRFSQIEPSVLIGADGYFFKGNRIETLGKLAELRKGLPSVKKTIVVPLLDKDPDLSDIPDSILTSNIPKESGPVEFLGLPFDHPLYILFSSGTTGKPKCIVHSAGGVLIEHLKELILHCHLKENDRIFYQTTCGWMMWNWLISSLAVGSTVLLYDGSPLTNDHNILFDFVAKNKVTVFGTNAKFLSLLEKSGKSPRTTHDLSSLRLMLSTGSPLLPEQFDYVSREIKSDLLLASISGGTDIIGCFALGCPIIPLNRGELQSRSLGMKVEVFDEVGQSVLQRKGELVCTAPFPSMPIGFWGDKDRSKYKAAYFERFPNTWTHGDYVEITKNDGMIFYGRSDSVLNPGGVRIGTAEIYRQVETLDEIVESVAIAENPGKDESIILFVRLRDGTTLEPNLERRIRDVIRAGASPFHVPKTIVPVTDIPRTRSGKIMENAIRDLVNGVPLKNTEVVANPESLEFFKNYKNR